jgi:hypothetical protein
MLPTDDGARASGAGVVTAELLPAEHRAALEPPPRVRRPGLPKDDQQPSAIPLGSLLLPVRAALGFSAGPVAALRDQRRR